MEGWSKDRDDQLQDWRREGFSYELIARKFTALGFKRSKGSVIGRAARTGLIGVLKKTRHHLYHQRNTIASGAALFEKIKATRPAVAVPPTPAAAGDFLGLTLIELDRFSCRYPHGDGSNIRFCGQTQLAGSSYCEQHHKVCNIKARMPMP